MILYRVQNSSLLAKDLFYGNSNAKKSSAKTRGKKHVTAGNVMFWFDFSLPKR